MSVFDRFSEATAWETEERREERERREEEMADAEIEHREWLANRERDFKSEKSETNQQKEK